MSLDGFAAFEEVGMNATAAIAEEGLRYRNTILADGGGRAPLLVFEVRRPAWKAPRSRHARATRDSCSKARRSRRACATCDSCSLHRVDERKSCCMSGGESSPGPPQIASTLHSLLPLASLAAWHVICWAHALCMHGFFDVCWLLMQDFRGRAPLTRPLLRDENLLPAKAAVSPTVVAESLDL